MQSVASTKVLALVQFNTVVPNLSVLAVRAVGAPGAPVCAVPGSSVFVTPVALAFEITYMSSLYSTADTLTKQSGCISKSTIRNSLLLHPNLS